MTTVYILFLTNSYREKNNNNLFLNNTWYCLVPTRANWRRTVWHRISHRRFARGRRALVAPAGRVQARVAAAADLCKHEQFQERDPVYSEKQEPVYSEKQ